VSFRTRRLLALRAVALIAVLVAPAALYKAAQVENGPLMWGVIALMAAAMALAVWVG
jgi:uncharacterized membrane protein YhfC